MGCRVFLTLCLLWALEAAAEDVASLGRFEVLPASPAMRGVTVGVPHADRTPFALAVARAIHSGAGAGAVVAHGFASRDLTVNAPVEGKAPIYQQLAHTPRARAVYLEYVKVLRQAAGGALGLHVDLREVESGAEAQVVPVGLTRDEASRVRGVKLRGSAPHVHPFDSMNYDAWIVRNDGVLLVAPRGLAIRLSPRAASAEQTARWLRSVIAALGPVTPEAAGKPDVLDRGRFTARKRASRVVVAAPHGSGDFFTDEVAERIAERLGASVLVVHGFMGTRERGFADRIAVNRPREGRGFHQTDYWTSESRLVYERYVEQVKSLTPWPPAVYVEIHCNDEPRARGAVEVATEGVSRAAAERFREGFLAAAARAGRRDVGLRIEPLDQVAMNAGGNKQVGIMGELPVSLHIEFPAPLSILRRADREVFTAVVGEALERTLPHIGGR